MMGSAEPAAIPLDVSGRRILGLALPALGVLAAEPLYLLFDIAVVGRLGALPLAGLAIGGLVLAQVTTQLTFLSYGTTARAARFHGADRHDDAVTEGIQATWLALCVGAVIVVIGQLLAAPVASLIAGDDEIATAAVSWLRVALFGAPLILISLAGNGWMRGVQDTARPLRYVVLGLGLSAVLCPILVHGLLGAPRWELVGSAVANVVGQFVAAALFIVALLRSGVSYRPRRAVIVAQLRLGRDLIARSLAFQVCFLSAAAVARGSVPLPSPGTRWFSNCGTSSRSPSTRSPSQHKRSSVLPSERRTRASRTGSPGG